MKRCIVILFICFFAIVASNDWSSHLWNGQTYYYNSKTGASQWEPPSGMEIDSSSPATSVNQEPIVSSISSHDDVASKPTRTTRRRSPHKTTQSHPTTAAPRESASASVSAVPKQHEVPETVEQPTSQATPHFQSTGKLDHDIDPRTTEVSVQNAFDVSPVVDEYNESARGDTDEEKSIWESMKNFVRQTDRAEISPSNAPHIKMGGDDIITKHEEESTNDRSETRISFNQSRRGGQSDHVNDELRKEHAELRKRFGALKRKYEIVCDNLAKSERDRKKLLEQRKRSGDARSEPAVKATVDTHSLAQSRESESLVSEPAVSFGQETADPEETIAMANSEKEFRREIEALQVRLAQQEEELAAAYRELEEARRRPAVSVSSPPASPPPASVTPAVPIPPVASETIVTQTSVQPKPRAAGIFGSFGQTLSAKSSKKTKSRRKIKAASDGEQEENSILQSLNATVIALKKRYAKLQVESSKKDLVISKLQNTVDNLNSTILTQTNESAFAADAANKKEAILREQLELLRGEYRSTVDQLVDLLENSEEAIGDQERVYIQALQILEKQLLALLEKLTFVSGQLHERHVRELCFFTLKADAACALADRQLREIEYLAEAVHESERDRGVAHAEVAALSTRVRALSALCDELRVAEGAATASLVQAQERIQAYALVESNRFSWTRVKDHVLLRIQAWQTSLHEKWTSLQVTAAAWFESTKKRFVR